MDSTGEGEVVVVDLPLLDDLKLLFERDAWWSRGLSAIKLQLQKE